MKRFTWINVFDLYNSPMRVGARSAPFPDKETETETLRNLQNRAGRLQSPTLQHRALYGDTI